MSIQSYIAKIGVNPQFIAFNAHAWFAYSVVKTFPFAGVAAAAAVLAALKEFWFDAKYEVPAQTFTDNLEDFAGYCAGILLASLTTWAI
jgi:hypothetical protein